MLPLCSHRMYDAVVHFHFAPPIPEQLHGNAVRLVCLPNSVFKDIGEEKQRQKGKGDHTEASRTYPFC